MGNNFHLQAACSSLIHFLEKEEVAQNSIRLSLDVQLPYHLTGDEKGLIFSITQISKFLTQQLAEGLIDIEILMIGSDQETVSVQVNVRGTDQKYRNSKKRSSVENTSKLDWVKTMPYKTSFNLHSNYYLFSFIMMFKHQEKQLRETALIFFGKQILLVEDNEMSASVFSSFLEEWGCKVTWVTNGKDALIAFDKNAFDMILMDSYMPGLNGNQVIKNIRVLNSDIPIIALAASYTEKDILKSISVGANDFLPKPISSHHLKKILKKYL